MDKITEVTYDKPIPVTRRAYIMGRYPWKGMGVSGSFFVPNDEDRTKHHVRSAAVAAQKRYGTKYTTRSLTEDGVIGIRVWRVR